MNEPQRRKEHVREASRREEKREERILQMMRGLLYQILYEVGLMFDRVTFDPQIMGGRACIRGMRITVSLVLNLVASGMTVEEILKAYPYLEAEDISACFMDLESLNYNFCKL